MTSIFDRISNELEYRGLKRADLSRMTGIPESTIRGWVSRDPRSEQLVLVARAFNMSLDYLITGKESNTITLSQEEKEFLNKFRAISDHDKNMVKTILDTAYSSYSQKIKTKTNA